MFLFLGIYDHVSKPANLENEADVEMPPPPVPPRKLLGAFAKAPKFDLKIGVKKCGPLIA